MNHFGHTMTKVLPAAVFTKEQYNILLDEFQGFIHENYGNDKYGHIFILKILYSEIDTPKINMFNKIYT